MVGWEARVDWQKLLGCRTGSGDFVTRVTEMSRPNCARTRALVLAGCGCAGMQDLHGGAGPRCYWFKVTFPPRTFAACVRDCAWTPPLTAGASQRRTRPPLLEPGCVTMIFDLRHVCAQLPFSSGYVAANFPASRQSMTAVLVVSGWIVGRHLLISWAACRADAALSVGQGAAA